MDPSNRRLLPGKLNPLAALTLAELERSVIAANKRPPAYDLVVDPRAPIPNQPNPYDPMEEEKVDDEEEQEITINAVTQIRGHGNIVSVQIDSNMIAEVLFGLLQRREPSAGEVENGGGQARRVPLGKMPGIGVNITINCGATVIGDRNIVGPGLGDIAKHMGIANRNQNASVQAQGTQAQAQGQVKAEGREGSEMPTPPLSPGSQVREGKRKADEEPEGLPQKRTVVRDGGSSSLEC
ncbi:hypothetical protein K469DRAFT_683175 [Zopfia rhizophila CBS 207.26]|uniref:Uncharacterized protein n=1 Tax=Zopfia rhizophila CBS 207.26 TaxID=1314779 RepID=A0A6A6EET0_9PEZI|nr:hypothetical protein K469DRAFT_683175 [Zopfia rhizophila CBS 207.26]